MKDKEKILRWKWEFMRLNPEYRADYEKLKTLRQKLSYDRLLKQIEKDRMKWRKDHSSDSKKVFDTANEEEFEKWLLAKREKELEIIKSYEQEEIKYSHKWSPGWSGKMYDPDKSYEEINSVPNSKDFKKFSKNVTDQWAFKEGLDQKAVVRMDFTEFPCSSCEFTKLLNIEKGDYFLKIEFSKVNSIKAIKEAVCKMLDAEFSGPKMTGSLVEMRGGDGGRVLIDCMRLKHSAHPKKGQRYEIDYDLILKVGTLKEKGKTNGEIAREINPRAFKDSKDEPANPTSAIRMISNYYKTYKELVTGGYKKISIT
ncbi:MAG: hypothetical protein K4571_18345 [Deltaproteobacteria bacterium]